MPLIKIPRSLQKYLSSPQTDVIVDGTRLDDCLQSLLKKNPDLKICFDEYGKLLPFANIYRGSEQVRIECIIKENDFLEIVVAMSGG